MCVNTPELSTKSPHASGLLYTLIRLDVHLTPPSLVIETRWWNNNCFCIQGADCARDRVQLQQVFAGGEGGAAWRASQTLRALAGGESLFNTPIVWLPRTRCRTLKIKNRSPFLLFSSSVGTKRGNGQRMKRDVWRRRIEPQLFFFFLYDWNSPSSDIKYQTETLLLVTAKRVRQQQGNPGNFICESFGRENHKCMCVWRVVSGYVPCHVFAINKDSPG